MLAVFDQQHRERSLRICDLPFDILGKMACLLIISKLFLGPRHEGFLLAFVALHPPRSKTYSQQGSVREVSQ